MIYAPLGPLAVVAGAGSGKSETMAARLVWLVANGKVRPDRVLGLTFTRKAAAEFADRVRSRLGGCAVPGSGTGRRKRGARRDRGPVRRGPGDRHLPRLRGAAGRRQRPTRGSSRPCGWSPPRCPGSSGRRSWQPRTGRYEVTWTPQTVTEAVLGLAGDMSEHLVEPGEVAAVGPVAHRGAR